MPKDIENKIKSNSDTVVVTYETNGDSETKVVEQIGNTIFCYKTKDVEDPKLKELGFYERVHTCSAKINIPEGYVALQKGTLFGELKFIGNCNDIWVEKCGTEIPIGTLIATLQLIKVEDISLVKSN